MYLSSSWAKMNGWKFIATEVDESSARYAENNVRQNGFTDKIKGKIYYILYTYSSLRFVYTKSFFANGQFQMRSVEIKVFKIMFWIE